MHVNTLQPGIATNTVIVQPIANYPSSVNPAKWRHREVALSGHPAEQHVNFTKVSPPPHQAVYYPVPLQVATLSGISAQSDTYPIAGASPHPEITVLFPAQESGLHFSQPTVYPTFSGFWPDQVNLNPYYSPEQAIPDTPTQFLPLDPIELSSEKESEVLEIMTLVISNGGKILTATIDGIAKNPRFGTAIIQLGRFNLKAGLRCSSPLSSNNLISSPIQGRLCFSSKKCLTQYLYRQPVGCFYSKYQQREPVRRIPLFLRCDEAELSSSTQPTISHDTIEPVDAEQLIPKIRDHLKSLNEKSVNARIVFFDAKQIGGIACHQDPTSGYHTYFMFKTPSAYKSIPASTLKRYFNNLRATITHSMSDTELSDYVASLGVDSFLDQNVHRKGTIHIFSHTTTFLTDD